MESHAGTGEGVEMQLSELMRLEAVAYLLFEILGFEG